MWKEIESYILRNREKLDVEEPRPELWKNIEKELDQEEDSNPVRSLRRQIFFQREHFFVRHPYWKVAAIVLITVSICYVMFNNSAVLESGRIVSNVSGIKPNSSHALGHAELAEMESYYNAKINEKFDQLNKYSLDEYSFSQEFLDEYHKAEANYMKLREALTNNGFSEEAHQGIIKNYELKLEILGKLLSRIQAIDQKKEEIREEM